MATTKIITQAEAFKLISWLESHNKQLFADVAITMFTGRRHGEFEVQPVQGGKYAGSAGE